MNTLTSSTRSTSGVAVISLAGRITIGDSALALRDIVRKQADTDSKIILNMADVSYIDSAGLGELVGCHTTMMNRRGAIKLSNVNRRILDLLKITRLQSLFEIHENDRSALDSFGVAAGV